MIKTQELIHKELLNERNAVIETLKELKTMGYRWRNIHYINKGRYAIIIGKDGSPNVAILLKTEVFFNFGKKFRDIGQKGVGDSINLKHLKRFKEYAVKFIYITFRDGKIYVISLEDFIDNSFQWTQKEGTIVKSISIHKYKGVNPD